MRRCGRVDDAIVLLDQATKSFPHDAFPAEYAKALGVKGFLLHTRHDIREALELYEKSLIILAPLERDEGTESAFVVLKNLFVSCRKLLLAPPSPGKPSPPPSPPKSVSRVNPPAPPSSSSPRQAPSDLRSSSPVAGAVSSTLPTPGPKKPVKTKKDDCLIM